MNKQIPTSTHTARWLVSGALVLLAATATAQTTATAGELREALKSELAPLRLSIKQQARAVTEDLVATVVAELANGLKSCAPGEQLARRDTAGADSDRS